MELANGRRGYRLVTGRFPGELRRMLWLLLAGGAATALAAVVVAAVAGVGTHTGVGGVVYSALLYGELALSVAQGLAQGAVGGAVQTLLGTMVVWAPFLLIEVFAHEMGHVLAGRLVGFRFVFCTIGPLKVTATGRGLALGYSENWLKVAGSFGA